MLNSHSTISAPITIRNNFKKYFMPKII